MGEFYLGFFVAIIIIFILAIVIGGVKLVRLSREFADHQTSTWMAIDEVYRFIDKAKEDLDKDWQSKVDSRVNKLEHVIDTISKRVSDL